MAKSWIEGAIGIWILLSPWLLGFANVTFAKWSSVVCGLVLIIMNAWSLFGEKNLQDKGQKDKIV